MKKLISVLLAVIMTLSMFTVAFVAFAEGETDDPTETAGSIMDNEQVAQVVDAVFNDLFDMGYEEFMALDDDAKLEKIKDMDLEQVITLIKIAKPVFKVAKIAIKLILVLDKLHILDIGNIKEAIVGALVGFIVDGIISSINTDAAEQQG